MKYLAIKRGKKSRNYCNFVEHPNTANHTDTFKTEEASYNKSPRATSTPMTALKH